MQPNIAQALAFQAENDVLVLHVVWPERRMEFIRCPYLKEAAQRQQALIRRLPEKAEMSIDESCMLVCGAPALSRRHAQQIRSLVPERV
jgi:hypothetical protein